MSNPIVPADDLFSTEIVPAIDEANQNLAEIGLRPYRVFLVVERYAGPGRREEPLEERGGIRAPFDVPTEILPRPSIRFASTSLLTMVSGALQSASRQPHLDHPISPGDALLEKVSRTYTYEELSGKNSTGGDLLTNEEFVIAVVKAAGSSSADLANLYEPSGEPELLPTGWRVPIRPINRRVRLVIGPDE